MLEDRNFAYDQARNSRMRDSEKAMSLAHYQRQINALNVAIRVIKGEK